MSTKPPPNHLAEQEPSGLRSMPQLAYGVSLPTFPQDGPVDFSLVRDSAQRAEQLGFGSVWLWDHVWWHNPCAESVTTAAALLAATDDICVGLGVLQIPLRHPHVLAAQLATLTDIGGDRFTLGIGFGQRPEEFVALGVDYDTRWSAGNRILATTLERFAQLRPGRSLRVIKGGRSLAAVRAAADVDGWMGAFVSPEGLASRLAQADPRPGWVSTQAFVCPPGHREDGLRWMSDLYRLPLERFTNQLMPDDPAQLRAEVDRYRQAGVDHLVFAITADDPTDTINYLAAELFEREDGGSRSEV